MEGSTAAGGAGRSGLELTRSAFCVFYEIGEGLPFTVSAYDDGARYQRESTDPLNVIQSVAFFG